MSVGKIAAATAAALLGAEIIDRNTNVTSDIRSLRLMMSALKELTDRADQGKCSVVELFLECVAAVPNKECLVWSSGGRDKSSWTFKEVDQITNRLSQWLAHVHGVTPGTVVALFFDNCPEIYFLQIALLKLAAIPCYINSNLRSTSLIHCANISGAKLLFTEDALFDFVLAIIGDLNAGVKVYNWGSRSDSRVETMTERTFDSYDGSVTLGAEARKQLKMNSTGAIIYTSGTTGLPKAAYMSMQKIGGAGYSSGNNYDANDRYYQCLPLFHSSGQIGVIIAWYQKTTLIVSRKFSATKFFIECAATNATCFQYIGELCRYLLAPPPNPKVDRGHKVVKCLGNGLRPDVWMEFKNRFGIHRIIEFYGATDTNVSMINASINESGVGVVGIQGPLLKKVLGSPIIVKFDVETEMPIRGKDGFCIEADAGEPGEILGRVPDYAPDAKVYPGYYEGYHGDQKATDKKLLRDVFVKGDCWVRTGDLLKRDRNGVIRFVDRIGDTFRWKGENVATTEVANILGEHPAVTEANVYGVQVAKQDGRAGMAAIVLSPEAAANMDATMADLGKATWQKLPHYAVPKFIRVVKEIEITATHKNRKIEYQRDGFDPAAIKDPLYWLDPEASTYLPFGPKEYVTVMAGKAKL